MNKLSSKKILLVNNSIVENPCPVLNFTPYFRFEYDVVDVKKGVVPECGDNYSHIILTGSSAEYDGPWQEREKGLIRWAYSHSLPLLGICFGLQLMAIALFGKNSVGHMVKPDYGWSKVLCVKDDLLMGPAGTSYYSFAHHMCDLKAIPEDKADLIASADRYPIAAIKIKEKPMWGLQPHFEMSVSYGTQVLRCNHGDDVTWKMLDDNPPKDSCHIYHILKAFQSI